MIICLQRYEAPTADVVEVKIPCLQTPSLQTPSLGIDDYERQPEDEW